MEGIYKTEALVLFASRWQESSKIVHLFSADYGYLKLIAKGALRPKSPFRGVLEALNHVEIIFSCKKSRGLQILNSASLLDAYLNIREDLSKTAIAFSILELFKKLLQLHEPIKSFFQYTLDLLNLLNDSTSSTLKIYLWHFLIKLSQTLGFGWQFTYCSSCKESLPTAPILFNYQNGEFICKSCKQYSQTKGILLTSQQCQFLMTFSDTKIHDLPNLESKKIVNFEPKLTHILLNHLMYHTEIHIELKSLKWYI